MTLYTLYWLLKQKTPTFKTMVSPADSPLPTPTGLYTFTMFRSWLCCDAHYTKRCLMGDLSRQQQASVWYCVIFTSVCKHVSLRILTTYALAACRMFINAALQRNWWLVVFCNYIIGSFWYQTIVPLPYRMEHILSWCNITMFNSFLCIFLFFYFSWMD